MLNLSVTPDLHSGRENNIDRPYDIRGEELTSTHKRGKGTTGGNNVNTFTFFETPPDPVGPLVPALDPILWEETVKIVFVWV